ncbi:MAG: methionine--tRNA ligase subunit beta, partial [Flavobacteriaceae bacterium]|nr:methionine--tRNA ligase subunit beta [Flavobacteriaceae bacterium]
NDFTWKDFQARNNNELVAVLGNFVNRALVLTNKYFDGKVPAVSELTEQDKEVLTELPILLEETAKQLDEFHFREGLKVMMNIARLGNKYLAETEPWKLWKTEPERVATILNVSLQIVGCLSMAMEPFLPFAGKNLREMLQVELKNWNEIKDFHLAEGHQLGKPALLFAKIEDEEIQAQVDKLEQTKIANAENEVKLPPIKDEVDYDTFCKLDLRVGTIKTAERVPKTDKLLKLTIDIGSEVRTVVSGIAKDYEPEKVIGTQVTLLTNLAPRKIRGILSQGMILMAENTDGKLAFVSPDKEVNSGSGIA